MIDDYHMTGTLPAPTTPVPALGPWLRTQRKARGWTLAKVGERTGYSVSYISEIERGQRGDLESVARLLQKLCTLYGYDLVISVRPQELTEDHDGPLADAAAFRLLLARDERASTALHTIAAWADAYPVEAFPEVDLDAARAALDAAGLSMGALHAQWARRLLRGVGETARRGLDDRTEGG